MKRNYISLEEVSNIYSIDIKICLDFVFYDLLEIKIINNIEYIPTENLDKIKRIVNLYKTLGVNKEGIDIILEMREKIIILNEENQRLKEKIKRFEEEFFDKNIYKSKINGNYFEID